MVEKENAEPSPPKKRKKAVTKPKLPAGKTKASTSKKKPKANTSANKPPVPKNVADKLCSKLNTEDFTCKQCMVQAKDFVLFESKAIQAYLAMPNNKKNYLKDQIAATKCCECKELWDTIKSDARYCKSCERDEKALTWLCLPCHQKKAPSRRGRNRAAPLRFRDKEQQEQE